MCRTLKRAGAALASTGLLAVSLTPCPRAVLPSRLLQAAGLESAPGLSAEDSVSSPEHNHSEAHDHAAMSRPLDPAPASDRHGQATGTRTRSHSPKPAVSQDDEVIAAVVSAPCPCGCGGSSQPPQTRVSSADFAPPYVQTLAPAPIRTDELEVALALAHPPPAPIFHVPIVS